MSFLQQLLDRIPLNENYADRPTVDITKLTEPFDPELLGSMIDDHEAKIFIKHWDLDDVFSDAKRQAADDGMAHEQSDLNITKDSEVTDITGNFSKVFYNVKTHKLYVECDFKVYVKGYFAGGNKGNKGQFWQNNDYQIEVTDSNVEVKLEAAGPGWSKTNPDIVDLTQFYKETYAD
jgi:hypothetical protein